MTGAVSDHYNRPDLLARIERALGEAGKLTYAQALPGADFAGDLMAFGVVLNIFWDDVHVGSSQYVVAYLGSVSTVFCPRQGPEGRAPSQPFGPPAIRKLATPHGAEAKWEAG